MMGSGLLASHCACLLVLHVHSQSKVLPPARNGMLDCGHRLMEAEVLCMSQHDEEGKVFRSCSLGMTPSQLKCRKESDVFVSPCTALT